MKKKHEIIVSICLEIRGKISTELKKLKEKIVSNLKKMTNDQWLKENILYKTKKYFFIEVILISTSIFCFNKEGSMVSNFFLKIASLILFLLFLYLIFLQIINIYQILKGNGLIKYYYICEHEEMHLVYIYLVEIFLTIFMLLAYFFSLVFPLLVQNAHIITMLTFIYIFEFFSIGLVNKCAKFFFKSIKKFYQICFYFVLVASMIIELESLFFSMIKDFFYKIDLAYVESNIYWISVTITVYSLLLLITLPNIFFSLNIKTKKKIKIYTKIFSLILFVSSLSSLIVVIIGKEVIDKQIFILIALITFVFTSISKILNFFYSIKENMFRKKACNLYREMMRGNLEMDISNVKVCCYYGGDEYINLLYLGKDSRRVILKIEKSPEEKCSLVKSLRGDWLEK